jgi:hypothetical protein
MRPLIAFIVAMGVVGQPTAQTQPAAVGEADPGVRPIRLIDRAEIRVSRVEIQAGATRRVHQHDDVEKTSDLLFF